MSGINRQANPRNFISLHEKRALQVTIPEADDKIVDPHFTIVATNLRGYGEALVAKPSLLEQSKVSKTGNIQVKLERSGPTGKLQVQVAPGLERCVADTDI